MFHIKTLLICGLALSAAACTNPDRFGGGADGAASATTGAGTGVTPGSAADPTSAAYFAQTIGDRVFFEVDQSTLTDLARSTLSSQAQWLITNSDYIVNVEGHADEQGTREYNLALGARRAEAAKEFLISKGVPASRLRVVSYGKERPVEICSQEACYNKNRRAVTVLTSGLTG